MSQRYSDPKYVTVGSLYVFLGKVTWRQSMNMSLTGYGEIREGYEY